MRKQWTHSNPVRILAGCGSFGQLGAQLSQGKWLLITSSGAKRRGWMARLISQLAEPTRLVICDTITPNPELEFLDRLTQELRQTNFSGLIAIGGGSVIDAAKVLSVTLPSKLDEPLAETLRKGTGQKWDQNLPVIAIPTTSGTGAEVTPFATVWDQENLKKHSVTADLLSPKLAILDPELTLTLPHDETLYTGLDALSHALESLWNRNKTPITEAWALHALELANEALPRVLREKQDLQARETMQMASLLAGFAISQTRTALAHSISYPLTSHYGVPHGLACSFTLPALIGRFEICEPHNTYASNLLKRTRELIESQNLSNKLNGFVSISQIESLEQYMFALGRAENMSFEVEIRSIVQTSIL